MGKFGPVFLAFLLNCFAVNIFTENVPGCEPLVSSLLFLLAVSLLLAEVPTYPNCLRKLPKSILFVIEFVIVDFIMEHVMASFWFPLEQSVASFLPKVAQFEADLLKRGGWDCGGVIAFLGWDVSLVIASYVMSLFFLLTILHTTRLVDFRLLKRGYGVFFKDISCRLQRLKCRLMRRWGCNPSRRRGRKSDIDDEEIDDNDECDCDYDEEEDDDDDEC